MCSLILSRCVSRQLIVIFGVLLLATAGVMEGQQTVPSGVVRGRVADQTDAVIPGAAVTLTSASGAKMTAQSSGDGTYTIRQVPMGTYTLSVDAQGFAPYTKPGVVVGRLQSVAQDVKLEIQTQTQQVVVTDQSTSLDTSPDNNASAMSIKGKDLDALSDDPDELSNELQALAGPSAGPNGGQIYVDGFTGGQLPPKSAIREIRINQNPFSAQFDRLGYGRIEILTKPGTDKFHGQFIVGANPSQLNTLTPFSQGSIPPYYNLQFSGNVSGPISKTASFFLSGNRRIIQDDDLVYATTLDQNLNIVSAPFQDSIFNPQTRMEFSPRIDLQLGEKNTLTARYQYEHNTNTNNGTGALDLRSVAYNNEDTENELQISDTQILSDKVINETRFQYQRNRDSQIAQNNTPTINVQGAFTGGGSSVGISRDASDHYELQNYTSIALSKNFIRFGARLRTLRDSNYTTSGFNGQYIFHSIQNYQTAARKLAACASNCTATADQYNVTTGAPIAKLVYSDLGVYAEDDWKWKPNVTLTYGTRFETQSSIHDKADFSPRIAIAWAIGHDSKAQPKTVLRAGYGIFYDRFGAGNVLNQERQSGLPGSRQQFIITNPDFYPNGPTSLSTANAVSPTIYTLAPNLRAAYTMQFGGTLERKLSNTSTLSVTYLNSHGVHQFVTENVNAPLPGTFNPAAPNGGVRPNGTNKNIYQYSSEGVFNQNQVISNIRVQANRYVSFFGFYIFSMAKGDTNGGFPSNSYNLSQDYGYTNFDRRNRGILVGNVNLPYQISLAPFVIAISGSPFNITTGSDLNGDSILNDRPAFATDLTRSSVVKTALGNFDTQPTAGQTLIPINYGRGPAQFVFNLRMSKAFAFGPKVAGGPPAGGGFGGGGRRGGSFGIGGLRGGPGGPVSVSRKYSLSFSAQALNLFNDINRANPVGILSSQQLFDKSTQLSGNIFSTNAASRRIYVQAVFSF